MQIPSALAPGDRVRVIAPSGPFDRTLFFRGLGWLSERYRVVWSRGALERQSYLAGTDQRRLDELNEALRDPTARAVIGARGGYGATRICHLADFESLVRFPKWCVGFSDFTALHLEAGRLDVASMHAANLTALGRGDQAQRELWLRTLERPLQRRTFDSLRVIAPGRASGTLAGGNLSLLCAAAAAGRLVLPTGCLLVLEEVNEAPYRLDRMLTSLLVGGHLSRASGVCLGSLTGGGQPGLERDALEAVRERLTPLGVPVLGGLPIGHAEVNQPLPLGLPGELSSEPPMLVVNPSGPAPGT